MDELTKYIFNYYAHLLTLSEKAAYKSLSGEEKAQNTDSPELSGALRRRWVSTDPQVTALLANGREAFMVAASDRVLREHAAEVFLNHCPKCGALAKTPRARQCPKCFFSWHSDV